MEARTNDVCSRPVLISRQLTPHPHPQHVLGTKGGVTTEHRVHYTAPNQQPTRRSGGGHREPQLNTAHHGRTTTVTYPPPRSPAGSGTRVTAVIAWGKRPVPSRTRKLRPAAPMVLHPEGCGRVGHRRTTPPGSSPRTTRCGGSPHLTPIVFVESPPTTAYGRGPGPGDDEEEPCDGAG